MANIFVLPFFALAWAHRLARRGTFQRLDATHLIDRHGHLPLLGALGGLGIGLTDVVTFLVKRGILDGIEPAAHAMRLEVGLLLKNAPQPAARPLEQDLAARLPRQGLAGSNA